MTIVTATRLRTDNEDIEDSFCLLRTSNQEMHHRKVLDKVAIKLLEVIQLLGVYICKDQNGADSWRKLCFLLNSLGSKSWTL